MAAACSVVCRDSIQVKVSKPNAEELAVLEEQFGEKQKAKQKKEEETIEETTTLHGNPSLTYNVHVHAKISTLYCTEFCLENHCHMGEVWSSTT